MAIKSCSGCRPDPYQDRKYGDKQRVHNPCNPKTGGGWRCTICGNERLPDAVTPKPPKAGKPDAGKKPTKRKP